MNGHVAFVLYDTCTQPTINTNIHQPAKFQLPVNKKRTINIYLYYKSKYLQPCSYSISTANANEISAMASQLFRFSPVSSGNSFSSSPRSTSFFSLRARSTRQTPFLTDLSSGGGDGNGGGNKNFYSGGNGGGSGGSKRPGLNPLSIFLQGWRSRVSADPQFPFKVLMEEIVGVSACVLGDMASRPNFGLNELDFVFSTIVVGSIVNFVLMYLLAPTVTANSCLPGVFASCPSGHIFQLGKYSAMERIGTFLYKGSTFAVVGFAAGLAGTVICNGLISLRRKMDPDFEIPSNPPPAVLNALTWSIHMGLSSNLRYQSLNGMEFLLERSKMSAAAFRGSIIVLRCLNNVLGGVSFVALARLTGSQKKEEAQLETPAS